MTWSLGPAVSVHSIGELGEVLSTDRGESEKVAKLVEYPEYVAKFYKSNAPARQNPSSLSHLIALPGRMTPAEKALVDRACSWPVSRIVSSGATVGVVLPLAPTVFKATFRTARGSTERYLEVDWMSASQAYYARSGISMPTLDVRLQVSTEIVRVAALLEKYTLVYADWSYVNAFWSASPPRAYLLDMDGIAPHSRTRIVTQNWDDPLTPPGLEADAYSDRYGLALMVGRCITGERPFTAVGSALRTAEVHGIGPVYRELRRSLFADERTSRPTASTLLGVLENALLTLGVGQVPEQKGENIVGNNVTSWRSVPTRKSTVGAAGKSAQESVTIRQNMTWQSPSSPRSESGPSGQAATNSQPSSKSGPPPQGGQSTSQNRSASPTDARGPSSGAQGGPRPSNMGPPSSPAGGARPTSPASASTPSPDSAKKTSPSIGDIVAAIVLFAVLLAAGVAIITAIVSLFF